MKKLLFFSTVFFIFQSINICLARDFGPEWKKITFENSNYVEYQRHVEINATHAGIGNVTNYPLQLESHNLSIFELDENLGLNIHIRQFGEFSLAKDLQGNPESFTIALGSIRYFDLNGDGYIDARYDGNKESSEIFYQDKILAVKSSKDGLKARQRVSLDGNTQYVFSEGKWVITN